MATFSMRCRALAKCVLIKSTRSTSLHPVSRPLRTNHFSILLEKGTFEVESRSLLIQKSLEHLKNNNVAIDKQKIKSISINDRFQTKGTDGASLFLYERVPQLKYHNPEVKIACARDSSRPWQLDINLENGESTSISVGGKSCEEIFSEVCEVISLNMENSDIT